MDPVRAQEVKSWAWRVEHVETWRDHADEVRISVRRRARGHEIIFRSGLKPPRKKEEELRRG